MSRGIWSADQFALLPSLSVAAHELKTPIALMRQFGLLLQDETLSDAERRDYQSQLILTAERALALTTDISQATNLQPSLFPLEPINPVALCRSMAREMQPLARVYGRDIVWPQGYQRTATLAIANPLLFRRVLANFLDNALKYTEPNVPIRVSVRCAKEVVRVSVRDHGPQLTRREYQALLDDMEHMKVVRTRPESSGLGIFLAAEFARAMNGMIGLTRHRDGVTFYVELPLSQQMRLV